MKGMEARQDGGAAVLARALELGRDNVADADARAELRRLAGGSRLPLLSARDALVRRLHERSDDFEASRALSIVASALRDVGFQQEPFRAGPTGARLVKALRRLRPARKARTAPRRRRSGTVQQATSASGASPAG